MWAYYDIPVDIAGATTAVCLLEIQPADDVPVIVTKIDLEVTSEVGEAQEEWLKLEIQRGGTAITSGNGSAATPQPKTPKMPAALGTYETGATTLPTYTSGTTPWKGAMNVRAGVPIPLPPEEAIGVTQANGGMDIRMTSTPADALDLRGTITIAEWI